MDAMTYDINSGFDKNDQYSAGSYGRVGFQVYPELLILSLACSGRRSVVVWRGWYSVGGAENDIVRQWRSDRETTVARISVLSACSAVYKSRGYVPKPFG